MSPLAAASALSLRPTEEKDLPGLSELFVERFGHPLSTAEWRWKYQQLPGEARSWVAEGPGGELLAHAGALCLPARFGGREGGIWQLTDWLGTTRGRGLRAALVELGRRLLAELPRPGEAPWIFGFPSERHFRLGVLSFDYRALLRFHQRAGEIPSRGGAPAGVKLEVADRVEGDWVEELWRSLVPAGVIRSRSYLLWRYWARPHRFYRFYRLRAAAGSGLAVFAGVGQEAQAAELWLPPGAESGLLAIAADLRAAGFTHWRFWPGPLRLEGLGLEPGERVFVGCRGGLGAPDPRPAAEGFLYALGDWDLI